MNATLPANDTRYQPGRITPRTIRHVAAVLCVAWSLVIAAAAASLYRSEMRSARQAATVAARSQFVKDVIYRRWNARLGGVYGQVAAGVEPNPYLTQVDDRDIRSISGEALTLINPAYMTRQVHELGLETEGIVGHITSLDPIRPENAPEPWEAAALRSFEEGVEEASSVSDRGGRRVLRLMRPLVTEESCLRCHAQQGYRVGDIRGGISVSVPMAEYLGIAHRDFTTAVVGYGAAWLLGIAGVLFAGRSVGARARRQIADEQRIQDLLSARELMLREVHHRVKNNMSMMSSLLDLKAMSVQDERAADALTDVADRFGVMSTLYDTLYRAPNLDGLSTSQFLGNVVDDLAASVPRAQAVALRADVADVELSVDTLSALGILVAEAVTNALKYAFPNGSGGTVEVRGRVVGGHMELTVHDDGVGLPPGVELDTSSGLGLRLIGSLAEQISGRAEILRQQGTGIRVVFPVHA